MYVVSGKKYPKLIVKEDAYLRNYQNQDRNYWRCSQYFKTKCKSNLTTYGHIVQINNKHNHSPLNPQREKTTPLKVKIIENDRI